jgi:hypothetical protein
VPVATREWDVCGSVLIEAALLARDDAEPYLRSRSSRDGKRSSGVRSVDGGALLPCGFGDGGPSLDVGRGFGDVGCLPGMSGAASVLRGRGEDGVFMDVFMFSPAVGSRVEE